MSKSTIKWLIALAGAGAVWYLLKHTAKTVQQMPTLKITPDGYSTEMQWSQMLDKIPVLHQEKRPAGQIEILPYPTGVILS